MSKMSILEKFRYSDVAMSNKKWKMGQIFMGFSEFLNFTIKIRLCSGMKNEPNGTK
jgi:hypothetical protein